MPGDLLDTLHKYFGLTSFRSRQDEAIKYLLAGHHALIVMPTGAGKSLIYQLTALHRPGLTLVVSPLIALMKDQVDSLTRRHIPATFINSSLSTADQTHRLQAMAEGAFKLVYVAPERLRSDSFQQALRRVSIGLLAVDEAHCISQWGHDFRPEYLRIAEARVLMGNPLTVALTATATPQVQDDIVRRLDLSPVKRLITGFNRANLTLEVIQSADMRHKQQALIRVLKELADGAAIVYVGTKRMAEEVATLVQHSLNVAVEYYHAGLEEERRSRIQDAFLTRKLSIIVATNAFGMGIDRPDVRLVVHYSLPGSLEAYYQEAGRAGRDGHPARAVLFYSSRDHALHKKFIREDLPTADEVRALYKALNAQGEIEVLLTGEELVRAASLAAAKVRAGLAYLESVGAVQRIRDHGKQMLIRLGRLEGRGLAEIVKRLDAHRRHRHAQLQRMIRYAEAKACRRRILLAHFGDRAPAQTFHCCDLCRNRARPAPAEKDRKRSRLSPTERIALIILDALRREQGNMSRVGLVRLLRGSEHIPMPGGIGPANPYHGRLAQYASPEVDDMIGQLIARRYIEVIHNGRGIRHLTHQGKVALKACLLIPLRLPRANESERVSGISEPGSVDERSEGRGSSGVTSLPVERVRRVVQLGELRSPSGIAELLVALEDKDGNVRRLAASALGKIKDRRAVDPLITLLAREVKPQVRQYAVKALGRIRDVRARSILEKIASDDAEREYTRAAAQRALKRLSRS
jgi:ATP-dependent DNA helicase RecQ